MTRWSLRQSAVAPELMVLSALALLTRCWDLLHPRVVVWDETHYERFAGAYFTGGYYVDVHPPFAKLLIAATAKLLGSDIVALVANQPVPELRILPALAGALIIPVVWLLLRELGAGRRVATLGAALLLVDNGLLVTSRLILIDSMLVLFTMCAVLAFLVARRRDRGRRWAMLALAGLAAGMAASTKWTGLSALGLVGAAWAIDVVMQRRPLRTAAAECAALVAVPAIVYVASFAVHFALLSHAGIGDGWMSPRFRATLEGDPAYRAGAEMPLGAKVVELNRVMTTINAGWATDTHRGASAWYTWPIAKHSMGFWSSPAGQQPERWIVLFGNPLVWWSAIAGMLVVVAAMLRGAASLRPHRWALAFLGGGWTMNFIPFAFIHRPMYLYHYLVALVFSTMFAAIGVGALVGWTDDPDGPLWHFRSVRARQGYVALLAAATALFAYLAPMSYGWPLSASAVVHRRWILERNINQ